MIRAAALLCLATLTARAAAGDFATDKASNWHHWRGPNADGTAPNANPPTKWDATTNIKWKVELPGRGGATPIVWGDKLFVVTAIKTDRKATAAELPKPDARFERKTEPPTHFYKFVVMCFDRNTGKPLWEKVAAEKVPHEGHHTSHSYAAGTPTTDGKRLYVSFGSFGNFCYTLDGELIWQRDIGRINSRLGWGESVTPVIHGNSLLLNWDQEADSALHSLDAATGEVKWTAKRDEKTSWSTPLVTEFGGKTQVVANGTTRIRSYDITNGAVLWECAGMTVNPIPSPVRYGDNAVVMSGYRGAAAVSVPLVSKGDLGKDGKVEWRTSPGTPYVPSPVLVGDRLYFTQGNDGLLTILDAKSGKPVVQKERLPQAKTFYASPMTAAGRVYFVDRVGTTVVLKAGDAVEVLAVNKLDDPIDASPVAVGKSLYLRGEKYLYCVEEK